MTTFFSKFLWAALAPAFLLSCASGHCRETVAPLKPQGPSVARAEAPRDEGTEWVYKYDGSLQCSQGHQSSLDQTAQQLEGVKIYSQEKRTDTLMRVQVCGQPTGRANVYEISKQDLQRALDLGFKVWDFE